MSTRLDSLGMFLSARSGIGSHEAIGLALRAEELGFMSVFASERAGDSLGLSSGVAAHTARVKVGVGITNVYLRHPLSLAGLTVALDELSGNRMILGVGVGSRSLNERALGIPMQNPVQFLKEYVQILQCLLSGQLCNVDGKYLKCVGVSLDHRPAHKVPVILGGFSPGTLALAGDIADGVLLNLMPLDQVEVSVRALRMAAERAARDYRELEVACVLPCSIDEDEERSLRGAKQWLAGYVQQEFAARQFDRCGFNIAVQRVCAELNGGVPARAHEQISDEMARAFVICGDGISCAKQVEDYVVAGVTCPVIAPVPVDGAWKEATSACLEGFGETLSNQK